MGLKARKLMVSNLKPIYDRIEKAAKERYEGVVLGEYLAPEIVRKLEADGYRVKTYTDGEFSESTIIW